MDRLKLVQIDLTEVTSADELHFLLRDLLGFPGWYGCNWDAFWDAITGLVQMPHELQILGWTDLSRRLPEDAKLMLSCLEDMKLEYPELAPQLKFD